MLSKQPLKTVLKWKAEMVVSSVTWLHTVSKAIKAERHFLKTWRDFRQVKVRASLIENWEIKAM